MTTVTMTRLDRSVTDSHTAQPALRDAGTNGLTRHLWIERAGDGLLAPHNARNAACAAGYDWRLPATIIDDLVSVVDALVSNAVCHAKWADDWPAVPVVIELVGPRLIVEVRDPDPTLPTWPTAKPFDIAAMLDDPDVGPDDLDLCHHQGLVDVSGRAELSAFTESVGKAVRAVINTGEAR
ncbi:MAG TPA: hypothetical protein VGL02_20560 [Streptomyces sp.]